MEQPQREKPVWLRWLTFGVGPFLFYTFTFCLLTYPLITRFSTHFFADGGDGLQNVWNIWWVNKAVTELHQSPWHTNLIHYPYGTTLIGHTLNPFNGFLSIPLLLFLTLAQAHNLVVLFCFGMAGVTAFWLCHHFSGSYLASLVGGYAFTFSNFHMAHADGHLQLNSLEWLPLFLLAWHVFLNRPNSRTALGAAGALFLVILCDYYYFFCCVVTAGLMVLWYGWRNRQALYRDLFGRDLRQAGWGTTETLTRFRGTYYKPLLVFLGATLLTSGPLAVTLLVSSARDPWAMGGHPPNIFPMDLLAPFIPEVHWRFAEWTRFYWGHRDQKIFENAVFVGLSVVFLAVLATGKRAQLPAKDLGIWRLAIAFFFLLSLGPALWIGGYAVARLPMPYTWAEWIFPPLTMAGVPVRFMIIPTLAAAVLAACGLEYLLRGARRGKIAAAALIALLVFETLPGPRPTTSIQAPRYAWVLASLPGSGAVLDLASSLTNNLYYQTLYNKPQVFGYIARVPRSVKRKDNLVRRLVTREQYDQFFPQYGIRYLVTRAGEGVEHRFPTIRKLYGGPDGEVYDLAPGAANP